jgi:hypothetical protein
MTVSGLGPVLELTCAMPEKQTNLVRQTQLVDESETRERKERVQQSKVRGCSGNCVNQDATMQLNIEVSLTKVE